MNRSVATSVRLALCSTGLVVGLCGAAAAQSSNHGSEQMHKSMMSGMQHMQGMKMTGDTDKDFAMMMKMHHQQALDMAKAQVAHGKSAEMKAMAEKIIKDQSKEITQLDAWLQKNK
ncbi:MULTISPECIES: DUF305 domain-containing protein [unclassified Roseateles]|uniref:DUF305 domain-containing protein n=1 Tax=unclassified Roseateles TaxID=2626991 RepID=UPI0006F1CBB5|nr:MULTISPECIES: DUF305 domain-containing protein [unclassified Roseateles]KQW51187.1 hypothetical protein ASC81_00580 [Pelomonas sp. Root405]KRA77418.1 hypothetical protein ASD88_00580 [Pelomonas sp. Root662]